MRSCPRCHTEQEAEAAVCAHCGADLSVTTPASAGAATPGPAVGQTPEDPARPEQATPDADAAAGEATNASEVVNLIDEHDLPEWLRALEEPGAAEQPVTNDFHAWLRTDLTGLETAAPVEPEPPSDPSEAWHAPTEPVERQPIAAAAIFAAAASERPARDQVVIRALEPAPEPAPAPPAPAQPPHARVPLRPRSHAGRSLAAIAIVVALILFLGSLAFFLLTVFR